MADYTTDWKQFDNDCKTLFEFIEKFVEGEKANPTHLIALNADGLKVAENLKRRFLPDKKIVLLEVNQKYKITKEIDADISSAILVVCIQNTGKTLRAALNYLSILHSETDLDLIIAVLYDKLNVKSVSYISPSVHGVGFINGVNKKINLPWE